MNLVKGAHIDALALNMAWEDSANDNSIKTAFDAARSVGGFKVFFSFDYGGDRPWDKDTVISMIQQYHSHEVNMHVASRQHARR